MKNETVTLINDQSFVRRETKLEFQSRVMVEWEALCKDAPRRPVHYNSEEIRFKQFCNRHGIPIDTPPDQMRILHKFFQTEPSNRWRIDMSVLEDLIDQATKNGSTSITVDLTPNHPPMEVVTKYFLVANGQRTEYPNAEALVAAIPDAPSSAEESNACGNPHCICDGKCTVCECEQQKAGSAQ